VKRGILTAIGAFVVLGIVISAIQVKGVFVPTKEEFDALVERVVALEEAVFPSPSPTPSPEPTTTTEPPVPTCEGVQVVAGQDLDAKIDANPPGTTFCVAEGTFPISQSTNLDDGDRIIGSGRDATIITIDTPISDPDKSVGFVARGNVYVSDLDISGADVPTTCPGGTSCAAYGQAFKNFAAMLTVERVDCHDNGGNCVGQAGSLTFIDNDCYVNGSAYSMTSSFRYAACVKIVAAYGAGSGNLIAYGNHIHDNPWNGLWADFNKVGAWDVHDNVIETSGARGIQWEMSGGYSATDSAHIYDNVIRGNGTLAGQPLRAGIHISTANDIIVENNTFGGQAELGVPGVSIIFTSSREGKAQPDSRGVVIRDNTMNGDAVTGCGLAGVVCSGNA
jgi:hypothetical protein